MGQTLALVMDYKGMQTQKAAAAAERQQFELAGKMEEISTAQDNVDRTRALYEQLASLNNQFASSGVTGAGATRANFARGERKMASRDISARKLMGQSQRRQYQLGAFGSKMKGKAAQYQFYGKAAQFGQKSYNSGQGIGDDATGSYLI